MGYPSPWTPKKVAALKKTWKAILENRIACSNALETCAAAIGMSRNQVAGKLKRLGMPTRRATERTVEPSRSLRPSHIRKKPHALTFSLPEEEVAVGEGVSIISLQRIDPTQELINEDALCSWPVADSLERKFCGKKSTKIAKSFDAEGNVTVWKYSPYCAFHSRIAYRPNPKPNRSKRYGSAPRF